MSISELVWTNHGALMQVLRRVNPKTAQLDPTDWRIVQRDKVQWWAVYMTARQSYIEHVHTRYFNSAQEARDYAEACYRLSQQSA